MFKRCKVLPVDSYLENGSERVPVHTFGFGSDHDPEAMLSIAEATGGSFCYVQEEFAVQHAFAQFIGGLLSVVAQEVERGSRVWKPPPGQRPWLAIELRQ
ncbi:hypothetical protein SELMODRAFT_99409 [Selaginella moellendorffii]|uniref:VWFA domain-containing protein n=1 Tax=Selaginella moellendorffii TaxID=88036 RepID=D8RQN5_SELML|nr:hypothetical protein SELMODRAFT_99409 [Selaginella moellendorffii]